MLKPSLCELLLIADVSRPQQNVQPPRGNKTETSTPGSLDPEVLKDRLSHAHARHSDLCHGGWRHGRRP